VFLGVDVSATEPSGTPTRTQELRPQGWGNTGADLIIDTASSRADVSETRDHELVTPHYPHSLDELRAGRARTDLDVGTQTTLW
jgi:hypothetical protein